MSFSFLYFGYNLFLLVLIVGRSWLANEMAWRQTLPLQLTTQQQQKSQLMLPLASSIPSTPQIVEQINSNGLLTLRDMMFHHQQHQQRLEKRRLSASDGEMATIKLPKLSPIISTLSVSPSPSPPQQHQQLPLSLITDNFKHTTYKSSDDSMSPKSYDRDNNNLNKPLHNSNNFNQRDNHHHQQQYERMRQLNERGKDRLARSRVNFEPYNSAKTVREELAASRSKQATNGEYSNLFVNFRVHLFIQQQCCVPYLLRIIYQFLIHLMTKAIVLAFSLKWNVWLFFSHLLFKIAYK